MYVCVFGRSRCERRVCLSFYYIDEQLKKSIKNEGKETWGETECGPRRLACDKCLNLPIPVSNFPTLYPSEWVCRQKNMHFTTLYSRTRPTRFISAGNVREIKIFKPTINFRLSCSCSICSVFHLHFRLNNHWSENRLSFERYFRISQSNQYYHRIGWCTTIEVNCFASCLVWPVWMAIFSVFRFPLLLFVYICCCSLSFVR